MPSEDVKKGTRSQLEQTFKEEIIPLIENLTKSEREYLSEQVDRIRKRGKFDKKLEEIRKMVDEQKNKETELKDKKEKLYWNKDAILKDLMENYVTVHENQEKMGYKGKIVEINLPGMWEDYNPFKYFVSDKSVRKDTFERNPELKEKSYSKKEVCGLLQAMDRYMQAMGVETDWAMDYENELKYWETYNHRCDAWDCLKQIAWLDRWYWLRDKDVGWRKNSRAYWYCDYDYCYFNRSDYDYYYANLFLRLS